MNFNRIRDDVVEVIARVILFKDRQKEGATQPTTDDWKEVYFDKDALHSSALENPSYVRHNRFKAEVDGTTAVIMQSIIKSLDNNQ